MAVFVACMNARTVLVHLLRVEDEEVEEILRDIAVVHFQRNVVDHVAVGMYVDTKSRIPLSLLLVEKVVPEMRNPSFARSSAFVKDKKNIKK